MLRPFILVLLTAPLTFAAPVPKELKRTDERAILGTWQMVVHANNAGPATPEAVKWRLEPDGRAFIMNPADTAIGYKLHPELSPKGFDWQWPTSLHMGLYELDGDTLRVFITSAASTVRPTELKPAPGVIYCEFKRIEIARSERTKPGQLEVEK